MQYKAKTESRTGGSVQEGSHRVDPATDGEKFHAAISRTKAEHDFGFAVDDRGRDFYTDPNTQLFLSPDGLAGVAVTDLEVKYIRLSCTDREAAEELLKKHPNLLKPRR